MIHLKVLSVMAAAAVTLATLMALEPEPAPYVTYVEGDTLWIETTEEEYLRVLREIMEEEQ